MPVGTRSQTVDTNDIFTFHHGFEQICNTLDDLQKTIDSSHVYIPFWRYVIYHRYIGTNAPDLVCEWKEFAKKNNVLENLDVDIPSIPPYLEHSMLSIKRKSKPKKKVLTVHIYYTDSNSILIQGRACNKWVTEEFEYLRRTAHRLAADFKDTSSTTICAVTAGATLMIADTTTPLPKVDYLCLPAPDAHTALPKAPNTDKPQAGVDGVVAHLHPQCPPPSPTAFGAPVTDQTNSIVSVDPPGEQVPSPASRPPSPSPPNSATVSHSADKQAENLNLLVQQLPPPPSQPPSPHLSSDATTSHVADQQTRDMSQLASLSPHPPSRPSFPHPDDAIVSHAADKLTSDIVQLALQTPLPPSRPSSPPPTSCITVNHEANKETSDTDTLAQQLPSRLQTPPLSCSVTVCTGARHLSTETSQNVIQPSASPSPHLPSNNKPQGIAFPSSPPLSSNVPTQEDTTTSKPSSISSNDMLLTSSGEQSHEQANPATPPQPHSKLHHSPDPIHEPPTAQSCSPSTLFNAATITGISFLQTQLQTAFQTIANMQETITTLQQQLAQTSHQTQHNTEQVNDSEVRVKNILKASSENFTQQLQDLQSDQSILQQQMKENSQALKSHKDSQANSLADIKKQMKALNHTKPTNSTTQTSSTVTDDTLVYNVDTANSFGPLSDSLNQDVDHVIKQFRPKQSETLHINNNTRNESNNSSLLQTPNNTNSKQRNSNNKPNSHTQSSLDTLMTKTIPKNCNMLLLGDSVFAGMDERLVTVDGYKVGKVAVSGMTVHHLQHWLTTCPQSPHIHQVIFHIGINDCREGPVSAADWGKLLRSLKRVFPNAVLQASSIIPPYGRHPLFQPASVSTSNLRGICKREGVPFIDNTNSFLARSGAPKKAVYEDSLHPSDQGYEFLAQNIVRKSHFQTTPSNARPRLPPSNQFMNPNHSSAPPSSSVSHRVVNNPPQSYQPRLSATISQNNNYHKAFPTFTSRDPLSPNVVEALGQPLVRQLPESHTPIPSSQHDLQSQLQNCQPSFPTILNPTVPPPNFFPTCPNLPPPNSFPAHSPTLPPPNSFPTFPNLPVQPPKSFQNPTINPTGQLHPLVVQFLNSMALQFTH